MCDAMYKMVNIHMKESLRLQALQPYRETLMRQKGVAGMGGDDGGDDDVPVPVEAEGRKGDGRPHPHWVAENRRGELPTCPWDQRRRWCAEEYGCRACETNGIDAPWAAQSQALLNRSCSHGS